MGINNNLQINNIAVASNLILDYDTFSAVLTTTGNASVADVIASTVAIPPKHVTETIGSYRAMDSGEWCQAIITLTGAGVLIVTALLSTGAASVTEGYVRFNMSYRR